MKFARWLFISLALLLVGLSDASQLVFEEHVIASGFAGAISVAAADIDRDGDPDVVAAARDDDSLAWWENTGGVDWIYHGIAGGFNGATWVHVADLDGDGWSDVLASAFEADSIAWFQNDHSGGFVFHGVAGGFDGVRSVHTADLDDDNDLDIVAAAYLSHKIAVWEQESPGVFNPVPVFSTNLTSAYCVYAGDLNSDHRLDIVAAASGTSNVIDWWRNDGAWQFTEMEINQPFNGSESVVITDVDADSDSDFVAAASGAEDIAWWENVAGSFTRHNIDEDFLGAESVYPADLDNDGDKDIVAAGYEADAIAWWENSGTQTFTKHTITSAFDSVWSVVVADIDGDGRNDIVAASPGPDQIKWWRNAALCGSITSTLRTEFSPYYVTCDLLVPAGDTLVIEPGVTLQFMGPYKFEVRGTLLAEGTVEDSIVFTTNETGGNRWRGLRFVDSTSSGSRLAYCLIEKGYAWGGTPNDVGGGVFCDNSSPIFTCCAIVGNSAVQGGGVGGGGVYGRFSSSPIFRNCTISRNSTIGYGGGVCFNRACSPTFTDCILQGNFAVSGGAMYVQDCCTLRVANCTFMGDTATWGGGVRCALSSSLICKSTIVAHSSGAGVYFDSGVSGTVEYCDFYGNSGGAFGGSVPPGLGQIVTTNHNDDSCDVYYNIFLDPLFANAGAGDFHLTANSSCIDAGDPTMFDPDCTPSDIGAFYFFHLAQPENLIVQQDGRDMVLRWSIVDSTECGYPTPIKSYVIYYEQDFDENWDFLTAVTDTAYRHENVVLFAPRMYYEVVATDVELDLINRVARPGMSQSEFMAALRRVE